MIIKNYPPNYKKIKAVFGEDERCVYCYGDIYNPHKIPLEHHIIVHEKVHSEQQAELGIDYWWMRYLDDKEFRLKMELEAYAIQYKYAKEIANNKSVKLFLEDISGVLASEVYGNLLSQSEAETKIRVMAKKLST